MRTQRTIDTVTWAILAAAAGVALGLPDSMPAVQAYAAAGPETIKLTGVARDFKVDHPDFGDVTPAGGDGHYAENVSRLLAGFKAPMFIGTGFKVDSEWHDGDGHPIAPQVADTRGVRGSQTLGVRVSETIELRKETSMDAFNSNYGPYGLKGNYGAKGYVSTNSTDDHAIKVDKKAFIRGNTFVGPGGDPAEVLDIKGFIVGTKDVLAEAYDMPEILPPDDLQGYIPTLNISGTVVLTGDTTPEDETDDPAMHVGDLTVDTAATLFVEGDLRIRVDGDFKVDKAQIVIQPEGNLSLFVTGDVEIKDESLINVDPGDTTVMSINALGGGRLHVHKKSHVYATLSAPARELEIKDASHVFGGFVGRSMKLDGKDAGFHMDLGNADQGPWNFALAVREKIELDENSDIDSFDSNDGPYGPGNIGSVARCSVNGKKKDYVKIKKISTVKGDVLIGPDGDPDEVVVTEDGGTIEGTIVNLQEPIAIPVVTPPTMGASLGDVEYKNGTFVINADFRCKKLKIEKATVQISGDVVIRCDDKVEMKDRSEIQLMPGSSLVLYVKKEVKLDDRCLFNMNTGNPQLVSIRMMSLGKKGKVEIKNKSKMAAWIQGAKTELKIEDNSDLYGSFTGRKIKIKKISAMHVDMAYLLTCVTIADTPGTQGADGAGGITSAATFDEWYKDVLGVNMPETTPITLTKNAGVWEYLDDAFYPLDGRGWGAEDDEVHNHHFTYMFEAKFEYEDCGRQFIEFQGGDGAWMFVDGILVMDLGGVKPAEGQYVEIDRLGLTPGETYDLHFFHAQRKSTGSVFRLRTNLDVYTPVTQYPSAGIFD